MSFNCTQKQPFWNNDFGCQIDLLITLDIQDNGDDMLWLSSLGFERIKGVERFSFNSPEKVIKGS